MDKKGSVLSSQILPVSATMIGDCMTVISVIQLAPKKGISSWADDLLAIDSLFFLASMMLSYWSIRHKDQLVKAELYADRFFIFGMVVMVSVGFLIAFELFTD